MKTPQFEELATRWTGKAQFFNIFAREAHPHAKGAPSNAMREMLMRMITAMDKDDNGKISAEEYAGPAMMFEVFDFNGDRELEPLELFSNGIIDDFRDIAQPSTYSARLALAKAYRQVSPGDIPVLIDNMDNSTADAYGGLPNSAFVIGTDGTVKYKAAWANGREIEGMLAELTGTELAAIAHQPPNWQLLSKPLARAQRSGKSLLLKFTSPGCAACATMNRTTLADASVQQAVAKYESVSLDISADANWELFEALGLSGTPGFVIVDSDTNVQARLQGVQSAAAFLWFLGVSPNK